MRTFNKKRNEDISELKKLHMLKDKTAFKQRKAEIMAEHKISKATVYREMKQKASRLLRPAALHKQTRRNIRAGKGARQNHAVQQGSR